jgi:hypothetical protein
LITVDFGADAGDMKVQRILSLQLDLVRGVCLDMFYDVATVLHGRPVEHCLRAWASVYDDELGNDADSMVEIKWENLLATSLVKDYFKTLKVHDALRHLGRVKCKSEGNAGKRVWVEDGKLQGLKKSNKVSHQ